MAERTTITQVVQLGVESTAGTGVAATRKLIGVSIEPGMKVKNNIFRPQWDKYSTVVTIGEEWTESNVTGVPSYDEIVYLLSGVLTAPTVALPAGVTAGAHQWSYAPSPTSPDSPQTYTVEHGSSVHADKFVYGQLTALNFTLDRSKFDLSGAMLGQQLQDGVSLTPVVTDVVAIHASAAITAGTYTIGDGTNTTAAINYNDSIATVQSKLAGATPGPINYTAAGGPLTTPTDITLTATTGGAKPTLTITPTAITGGTLSLNHTATGSGPTTVSMVPIIPSQVDLFLDSSYGSIGSTKLLRATSFSFALDSRFAPYWSLNSANASWATAVETAPKATAKLMLEADTVGMGLLTTMRAGSTQYLRLKATGPTIPGSTPSTNYSFVLDFAFKVSEPAPFKDDQGIYAIEWTFELVDDPTMGGAIKATVINDISAL